MYEWNLCAEQEEIQIKKVLQKCLDSKQKGEITDGFKVTIVRVGDNRNTEPYVFYRRVFKQLSFPIPQHTLAITVRTQKDECVMAIHVQFLKHKHLFGVTELTKANALRLFVQYSLLFQE